MASRARKVTIGILIVLALTGGGLLYLATQLDSIVARLIEEQGSAATQTDVRVSGVTIKLRDARAGVNGLSVANPDGFGGGRAIDLGEFSITIDPGTVTSDTVVLREVIVRGARINLLQQGSGSNLQALLDNLGGGGGDSADDSGGAGKKLIIDRFELEGATASVTVPALDEVREVTLPTIVLNDVGRASNGATGAAIARQLLAPVIRRTLQSAAAQSLRDRAKEQLDEAAGGLLEGVRQTLGGSEPEDN